VSGRRQVAEQAGGVAHELEVAGPVGGAAGAERGAGVQRDGAAPWLEGGGSRDTASRRGA
jgi:hypothetical protein